MNSSDTLLIEKFSGYIVLQQIPYIAMNSKSVVSQNIIMKLGGYLKFKKFRSRFFQSL